jgi:hypothetical protein
MPGRFGVIADIHDRRPGRALQGNLESFDGFAVGLTR